MDVQEELFRIDLNTSAKMAAHPVVSRMASGTVTIHFCYYQPRSEFIKGI